jgi:hypothetical protein
MIRLPRQNLFQHRQRSLDVPLRGVDLSQSNGRYGRWRLHLELGPLAANQRRRITQIETGFDDARDQVARDAQKAAGLSLYGRVRLGAAHDFVPELDSRHQLGACNAEGARLRDEVVSAHSVEARSIHYGLVFRGWSERGVKRARL